MEGSEKSKSSKSKGVETLEVEDNDDQNSGSGEESDELESVVYKSSDLIYNPESDMRGWLRSRGVELDFEDEQIEKLRKCFNSLDDDGSGEIGVDELEDPLIALGLVENRNQLQQIVDLVDEDGSGQIEFPEFLQIIKGGRNAKEGAKDNGTGAIYQFFDDLT